MNPTKSSKTYGQFYAHVHSKAHAPRSREVYLRWVERLGEHYQPEGPGLRRLSERQVLDYLIYLRDDHPSNHSKRHFSRCRQRPLARSSIAVGRI